MREIAEGTGPRNEDAKRLLKAFEEWGPGEREDVEVGEIFTGADVVLYEMEWLLAVPPAEMGSLQEVAWLDRALVLSLLKR